MTSLTDIKEQIEILRKQLDSAARNGLNDQAFYELNMKMDLLIEKYLDEENN